VKSVGFGIRVQSSQNQHYFRNHVHHQILQPQICSQWIERPLSGLRGENAKPQNSIGRVDSAVFQATHRLPRPANSLQLLPVPAVSSSIETRFRKLFARLWFVTCVPLSTYGWAGRCKCGLRNEIELCTITTPFSVSRNSTQVTNPSTQVTNPSRAMHTYLCTYVYIYIPIYIHTYVYR